jgi:hypothetical protein
MTTSTGHSTSDRRRIVHIAFHDACYDIASTVRALPLLVAGHLQQLSRRTQRGVENRRKLAGLGGFRLVNCLALELTPEYEDSSA